MRNYRDLKEYSVTEINGVLDRLRGTYDLVQLVDVEECRVLEVQPDGSIRYGQECYRIWNRNMRCANCSGYQACMTHNAMDKVEHSHGERQEAHSVPIYLKMLNGELELCVLDCIRICGPEASGEDAADHDNADYISTHDVLTRLYTQEKLFWEIRKRLLDSPEDRYLLVMGNIRNFRLVNKLYGIEGGNRVLVGIADLLREECTHEEVYGRYRDDRFVLLVRRDKFDEATFLGHMQRASALVQSPVYSISIQLGVYAIDDVNMPVATMLDHADLALSALRHSRKLLIAWYEPGMMERKLKDQHIIEDFELALQSGDFQIYLQPQVREDGGIFGAEALVRWVRRGKVVPPMDFLGVLHQSELLSHLDDYVWEQAAALLGRWKGTPFEDLYVSINVDPSDFYYFDVPERLKSLCARYGIDTHKLRVEITETALVEDTERQSRIVEQLHAAGFIVEIDDFGKGSSSLSMLKDIHADVLKIDMGFIRGGSNRDRSRVILSSVIDMAEQLSMDVITEGVETRDQVDRLSAMGCHKFQGFYYSRPIPVADFETVVLHNLEDRQ